MQPHAANQVLCCRQGCHTESAGLQQPPQDVLCPGQVCHVVLPRIDLAHVTQARTWPEQSSLHKVSFVPGESAMWCCSVLPQ